MRKKAKSAITSAFAIASASMVGLVQAGNPIVNAFIADPSAHVFNGRVYLYLTNDSANDGIDWNSRGWRALSSTDLVNWTDHGEVFEVEGGIDNPSVPGFKWGKHSAWAPAAIARDGYYYLYLPVDGPEPGKSKIGVARSTSPTCGFRDARDLPFFDGPLIKEGDENAGNEVIDPMAFVDDDGQAYLYYGGRDVNLDRDCNTDVLRGSHYNRT